MKEKTIKSFNRFLDLPFWQNLPIGQPKNDWHQAHEQINQYLQAGQMNCTHLYTADLIIRLISRLCWCKFCLKYHLTSVALHLVAPSDRSNRAYIFSYCHFQSKQMTCCVFPFFSHIDFASPSGRRWTASVDLRANFDVYLYLYLFEELTRRTWV